MGVCGVVHRWGVCGARRRWGFAVPGGDGGWRCQPVDEVGVEGCLLGAQCAATSTVSAARASRALYSAGASSEKVAPSGNRILSRKRLEPPLRPRGGAATPVADVTADAFLMASLHDGSSARASRPDLAHFGVPGEARGGARPTPAPAPAPAPGSPHPGPCTHQSAKAASMHRVFERPRRYTHTHTHTYMTQTPSKTPGATQAGPATPARRRRRQG